MAYFTDGLKNKIKVIEGGYSNKSSDYGGETNWGISKKQYPQIDISKLTFEDALEIYKRDFWNFYRCYEIESQPVAEKIFIAIINMNPFAAVRCVQKALNNCNIVTRVDGIMGSNTIVGINKVNENWMLDSLRVELCRHYADVVSMDKSQIANLLGWIHRGLE